VIESTQELAENKLILLYVFKKIKLKLTDEQITNIILENNLINYFLLKQYMAELVESGFLKIISDFNTEFFYDYTKGNFNIRFI
jgi:predicted transcriptional regulator